MLTLTFFEGLSPKHCLSADSESEFIFVLKSWIDFNCCQCHCKSKTYFDLFLFLGNNGVESELSLQVWVEFL